MALEKQWDFPMVETIWQKIPIMLAAASRGYLTVAGRPFPEKMLLGRRRSSMAEPSGSIHIIQCNFGTPPERRYQAEVRSQKDLE